MKKVTILLSVFALVMGLSQCRKPSFSALNGGETQHVVLSANNGNDGSKVSVSLGKTMDLKWEKGDKITVRGGLNGTLTLVSGDGGPEATFEGYATRGTGDVVFTYGGDPVFTGQTGTQEFVKEKICLEGKDVYKADGNYDVLMEVPYAVLKLDLSAFGTADGTTVTINELGGGTVASVKGVKNDEASKALYVAVPAPNAFGTPEESLVSRKYEFESSVGVASCDGWKLKNNTFYTLTGETGAAIVVTPTSNPKLLSGKFSVSATEYVRFSRGNLTYDVDAEKWDFYRNQYDHASGYDSKLISLFTWGYGTWSTNPSTVNYETSSTFTDWGTQIGDGSTWFTLSGKEGGDGWDYILSKRSNSNKLYGLAKVVGNNGLILLPDFWVLPEGCSFNPGKGSGYETNVYDAEKWSLMEAAGAVFLPACGRRDGTKVENVEVNGGCWSADAIAGGNGYTIRFSVANIHVTDNVRSHAYAVRLVQRFPKPDDVLEFKDLGLTSGTLWANMNLGAKRICDYGDYYAWGATEPYYTSYTLSEPSSDYHTRSKTFNGWKKTGGYSQANAPYYSGSKYTKYNDTDNLKTLEASDDAATQKLGPEYSIPTVAQFQELIEECEWEHVVYEGVSAYKVSGKEEGYKDMFIILPVCGRVDETNASYPRYADYWSNCVYYGNHIYAQYFEASNEKLDMKAGGGIGRYLGFPIRPVKNVSD